MSHRLVWTMLGIEVFALVAAVIIVWYIERGAKGGRG